MIDPVATRLWFHIHNSVIESLQNLILNDILEAFIDFI
jgi:hypothetical protein